MKWRTFFIVLGFLLFVLGMISLILTLIGGNLVILDWIDKPGTPRGIIIRLLMIGGGLVMSYVSLYPTKQEDQDITSGQ
jgi:hypothetical protein